jgi:phosphodiesterase/alkaline phosphatase D-like protein
MKKKVALGIWLGFLLFSTLLSQTTDASDFGITAGPTVSSITGSSATITWSLNSVATGQVQYGTTTKYGRVSIPELTYRFSSHRQTISDLAPGTTYHYRVVSTNASGVVVSPDATFITASLTAGFSITAEPTVSSITASSATIQWSLNSVATGQVQYGTTTAYGQVSIPELSYQFSSHKQTISGLTPGTTYHYRVVSTNASGVVVSPDATFTTASLTSGFSITAGPTVSNITGSSATIEWSLNSVGTGQVQYGTTTAYGQVSILELSYKFSSHRQTISGLAPGTTYHYRVISANTSAVQVVSSDATFTTGSGTSGDTGGDCQ